MSTAFGMAPTSGVLRYFLQRARSRMNQRWSWTHKCVQGKWRNSHGEHGDPVSVTLPHGAQRSTGLRDFLGGEGATSCEPAHHSTPNHSSAHQNPWPIGYDLGRRGGDTPCFPWNAGHIRRNPACSRVPWKCRQRAKGSKCP